MVAYRTSENGHSVLTLWSTQRPSIVNSIIVKPREQRDIQTLPCKVYDDGYGRREYEIKRCFMKAVKENHIVQPEIHCTQPGLTLLLTKVQVRMVSADCMNEAQLYVG